jgi:hypothetical protein
MKFWKIIAGFLITTLLILIAGNTYLNWFPLFKVFGVTLTILGLSILTNRIKKNLLSELLVNMGLAVIAICLLLCIAPPAIIYTILISYYRYDIRTATKRISKYSLNLGISLDQTGNLVGMDIFSDTLLSTGKGIQYGNMDQTISHVTGVQEHKNNLSWLGEFVAFSLNLAEKEHTINAKNAIQIDKNQREN